MYKYKKNNNKMNIQISNELLDEIESNELNEEIENIWSTEINKPSLYLGIYININTEYLLIIIDDSKHFIKLMNKYGQYMMIQKNKCIINHNMYICTVEPYIIYSSSTIPVDVMVYNKILPLL